MAQYAILPTTPLSPGNIELPTTILPNITHLDDPALAVMLDFQQTPPQTVMLGTAIDDALNQMKVHGTHLLFVVDQAEQPLGIIATEDILGEKPIKILQESRNTRQAVTVEMLMTTLEDTPTLCIEEIVQFKVGNIVNTLKAYNSHYALVIRQLEDTQRIRGIFTTSQISQQLHRHIATKSQ